MSVETKWALLWGSLASAIVIAETVALRSHHPDAPLSHHIRKRTRRLGRTPLGQVALHIGAGWLHRHLYAPVLEEMK